MVLFPHRLLLVIHQTACGVLYFLSCLLARELCGLFVGVDSKQRICVGDLCVCWAWAAEPMLINAIISVILSLGKVIVGFVLCNVGVNADIWKIIKKNFSKGF